MRSAGACAASRQSWHQRARAPWRVERKSPRVRKTAEEIKEAACKRKQLFKKRHPERFAKKPRVQKTAEERKEENRKRKELFKERHPEKFAKKPRVQTIAEET